MESDSEGDDKTDDDSCDEDMTISNEPIKKKPGRKKREIKCKVCDKIFISGQKLRRHQITHLGGESF